MVCYYFKEKNLGEKKFVQNKKCEWQVVIKQNLQNLFVHIEKNVSIYVFLKRR